METQTHETTPILVSGGDHCSETQHQPALSAHSENARIPKVVYGVHLFALSTPLNLGI